MDDADDSTAGIARDDNTKYSNSKPDFSSAQSISDHLWKSEPENWQETFQTNLTAQFFTTAAFLPLLAKGRDATPGYSSSVVNIASISGVMKGSSSGQFAYATSKAGTCAEFRIIDYNKLITLIGFIHLTRMMASTFAEAKVRVNCIAPGVFPSEMTAGSSGEDNKSKLDMSMSNPAGKQEFLSASLEDVTDACAGSGRPGSDSDMAACILFLAGPGGVFLNSQVLYPDGGKSISLAVTRE